MSFAAETPYNIDPIRNVAGHVVEYRELCEACMGGIELGFLFIDGHPVDREDTYGGPPLLDGDSIYAPRFEKGGLFRKQGFSICRIDLKTRTVEPLAKKSGFYLPYKREGNRLFLSRMIPKGEEDFVDLPSNE